MKNITKLPAIIFTTAIMFTMIVCRNDEEIQKAVEEVKEEAKVILINNNTGDNLAAGYEKITGLNPNKYYMVEEWSKDNDPLQDNPIHIGFVGSDGIRWTELGNIDGVKDGTIKNLTNFNIYRVSAASSLFDNGVNLKYFDLLTGSVPATDPNKIVTVSNGGITLPAPKERYYLNLDPKISSFGDYEVMLIPVSSGTRPWGILERVSAYFHLSEGNGTVNAITDSNYTRPAEKSSNPIGIYQYRANPAPSYLRGMSIMPLQGQNTVNDYLFINKNNIAEFSVLRVTIGQKPPEPGNLTFNITVGFTGKDNSPAWTGSSITYSINTSGVVFTLTVTNAGDFDTAAGIKWYFDGKQIATGNSISIDLNDPSTDNTFFILGTHELTAEATRNGEAYSGSIEIIVNDL